MSDPTPPRSGRPAAGADLTAPATQIVRNRADYLGEGEHDIGQRIAEDRLELFISTDPALAMQQQFANLSPQFIALHDIGASSTLRLLTAIATALGSKLQQLAIRHQGHGVALATLRFVEMPGPGKTKLRIYTTDIDADSQARRQLANVLLSNSRMGVLMVGELPPHALNTALQPVRDAIRVGPWLNRQLLLLPMGSSSALAAQSGTLAAGNSGIVVRVTPTAARPNDAWGYITAAWNRLRAGDDKAEDAVTPMPVPATAMAPARTTATATATASRSEPTPMPAARSAPATVVTPGRRDLADGRWNAYLQHCSAIKGLISACVFDFRSERALAHVGSRPGPERLAGQGATLFAAMAECSRSLGLGHAQPDAAIALSAHHLLLHPLPGHPGIVLHAVLDATSANLTLARMQLQRVDTEVLGAEKKADR